MVYVMLVETITNVTLTVALILIKTVLIKCHKIDLWVVWESALVTNILHICCNILTEDNLQSSGPEKLRAQGVPLPPPSPPTATVFRSKTTFFHVKEVVDKKSDKNDIGKRACSQKRDIPHTDSSMYSF